MTERWQWVWWGWRSWHLGFRRFDVAQADLAHIYDWRLFVGPVEIRQWHRR